jgi:hypothetical protein
MRYAMLTILCALLLAAAPMGYATAKMGVMTGPKTGTYHAIGQDIAKIAKEQQLQLMLRPSSGSIENLEMMANRNENAALGIVQADVMGFLERSDKPRSQDIKHKLRLVMPLYREEIHILARKEIESFQQLQGKRVVVGSAGSGSLMTSVNLFRLRDVKPARLYQEAAPEAIVAVMSGRADAMIFVGGKPVPMFHNLEQLRQSNDPEMTPLLEQVHFLPLAVTEALSRDYEPAMLTSEDYSYIQEDVSTLAVRSALVSFDFTQKNTPYYKARCKQLANLGAGLVNALENLRREGHAKWAEVEADRDIALWQRDECAWPAIQQALQRRTATVAQINDTPTLAAPRSPLEQELLQMITDMTQ